MLHGTNDLVSTR